MEKEKLDIVFNIRYTDNTKSVFGKNQYNAISHNENGIVSFRYDLDVYKPEIAPNGRVELYYPESDFIEGETVYGDVYYDEATKKYSALIEFKPRLKNIDLMSNAFDSYFSCAEMRYVPGYKDQCKAASWESPEICVKPKELLAIKNKKPKGKDSKDKIANLNQQIQDLTDEVKKLEIENANLKKAANSKDPKDMVNFLNQKIKDLEYKNQTLETENKNIKKDLEAEKNKSQKPPKDKNLEIKFDSTEIVKGNQTSSGYEPDENGKLIIRVNIKGDPDNPEPKLTGKIKIISEDDGYVCGIDSVGKLKYDESNNLYYAEVVCDPKLKATSHNISTVSYGRYPTIEYIPDDQSSYKTALFKGMMTIQFPVNKLLELENKKAENKNLDDPDKKIKDLENKNQGLEAENQKLKKDLEAEKNRSQKPPKDKNLEIKDMSIKITRGRIETDGVHLFEDGKLGIRVNIDIGDETIRPDGKVQLCYDGNEFFEAVNTSGKVMYDKKNEKYYADIVFKPKLRLVKHNVDDMLKSLGNFHSNPKLKYIPNNQDSYKEAVFEDKITISLPPSKLAEFENQKCNKTSSPDDPSKKIEDLEDKNQKLEAENQKLKEDLEAEKNKSQKPPKDKKFEIKISNIEVTAGKLEYGDYKPDENGNFAVRVYIEGDPNDPKFRPLGKLKLTYTGANISNSSIFDINSVGKINYDKEKKLYYADLSFSPKLKPLSYTGVGSFYIHPKIEYVPDEQDSYKETSFEKMIVLDIPVQKLLELQSKKDKNSDDPNKKIKDLEDKNQKLEKDIEDKNGQIKNLENENQNLRKAIESKNPQDAVNMLNQKIDGLEAENQKLKKDLEAEKNKSKESQRDKNLEVRFGSAEPIIGKIAPDSTYYQSDDEGKLTIRVNLDVDDIKKAPTGRIKVTSDGSNVFNNIFSSGEIKYDSKKMVYYADLLCDLKLKSTIDVSPDSHVKIVSAFIYLSMEYIPDDQSLYKKVKFEEKIGIDENPSKFLELNNKKQKYSYEVFDDEYINSYIKNNNLQEKMKNIDLTSEDGKKEIKNMVNNYVANKLHIDKSKAEKLELNNKKQKSSYEVFDDEYINSYIKNNNLQEKMKNIDLTSEDGKKEIKNMVNNYVANKLHIDKSKAEKIVNFAFDFVITGVGVTGALALGPVSIFALVCSVSLALAGGGKTIYDIVKNIVKNKESKVFDRIPKEIPEKQKGKIYGGNVK